MIFDLRRALRALTCGAGALLALVVVFAAPIGPVAAATAPKIVSVDVTGNLHVPTATIMAVVQARPGETYDPRIVQGDLARINALGYFADIAPPLVRQRPNGIAITYRVIENPTISKISFTGNTKVPSDTLLALMDLSVGQVFNTNTFRQDVLKINNYYERIGYGGQVPTHVKDLNLDPKTGALTLVIQEGLIVKQIIIGGDPLLPPPLILPSLTLKPGSIYSDEVRDADFKALQKLYENPYHLEIGNFEGGIDPSSIDLKAGTANVKYNIYVARISVVQITGNTRTKDQVVRRVLREVPGMVLNTDAVKRDYERLNSLGFFSKVEPDIKPGPDPKKPQLVTLVWHVTEQRTAQASVGFGYSGGLTGQGLYGTLGFSDTNLHGTGNSGSVQFEKGARTGVAQVALSIPYLGNTPKSQRYSASGQTLHQQFDVLLSRLRRDDQPGHSVGRRNARADPGDALSGAERVANQRYRGDEHVELDRRVGIDRASLKRLYDSLANPRRADDSLQHDRSVAVLLPRKSAEHLRRTDAWAGKLHHQLLRRIVRHRRVVHRQRQHRRALQAEHDHFELNDEYARRSVQSAARRQRLPVGNVFDAGSRIELSVHATVARHREVLPRAQGCNARRAFGPRCLDGCHPAE